RSNVPGITKKDRPLAPAHFAEFEKCYGTDPNGKSKRNDLGDKVASESFTLTTSKSAITSSTSHGSRMSRSKTQESCPNRRTWQPKRSPSSKRSWMT
ncbi:MAG: hypothetical protein LC776_03090, partial [Acidobacteria bacterium]|nr:hypothetical protein [Acidobacteriota bacterium]